MVKKAPYPPLFQSESVHMCSLQAALLGVDILMNPERIPPLTKDYYWNKQDCPIPYTQVMSGNLMV